jgi:aspartyl-tRNA(Asn)/glutamyl-tRNA(Gln) amidotransferase subunit C
MAKLCLSENERETAIRRAEALLESFYAIETVNTEGVAPMVSVLGIENVLREDTVSQAISRDVLLAGAPETSGGYFAVPKTLD